MWTLKIEISLSFTARQHSATSFVWVSILANVYGSIYEMFNFQTVNIWRSRWWLAKSTYPGANFLNRIDLESK